MLVTKYSRKPFAPLTRPFARLPNSVSALGWLAVVQNDSSPLSGFGRLADTRPGRMSALTDTGRSELLKLPKLDGS